MRTFTTFRRQSTEIKFLSTKWLKETTRVDLKRQRLAEPGSSFRKTVVMLASSNNEKRRRK